MAASVIYHCQEEGIPCPSILVFSDRGLQAKWFLDAALPRQALPRWNACQRYLVDRLAGLAVGLWRGLDELAGLWRAERRFDPTGSADWRASRLAEWHRAVERARGWAAP